MGIKDFIDSSDILIKEGKFVPALALLLMAVAASSVKLFPEGTISIDSKLKDAKSNNKMGSGEKFERFIGGRIQAIMFGDFYREKERSMKVGEGDGLEKHLYQNYRNSLLHEGKLESSVRFVHNDKDFNFSYTAQNGKIEVDYGLLNFLRKVVVGARVNGKLFDRSHYVVTVNGEVDDFEFLDNLSKEFGTTFGRLCIFREVLRKVGPKIKSLDDEKLLKLFANLVENGLNVTGLTGNYNKYELTEDLKKYVVFPFSSPQLCQENGILTNLGLSAFKKVIESYDVIDAAE